MSEIEQIQVEIKHNDRVFILMMRHAKANLLRDLNRRRGILVRRLDRLKEVPNGN